MLEEDSLAPFGTLATTDRRKKRYFVSHADFAPALIVVSSLFRLIGSMR